MKMIVEVRRRIIEFSFRCPSECVDLSSTDVDESSPSFSWASDWCLHCYQQAENNILYQQLKLQPINLDHPHPDTNSIQNMPMTISGIKHHKAVRTTRYFSNQRRVRPIVDLENNSSSKWFLPKAVQFDGIATSNSIHGDCRGNLRRHHPDRDKVTVVYWRISLTVCFSFVFWSIAYRNSIVTNTPLID